MHDVAGVVKTKSTNGEPKQEEVLHCHSHSTFFRLETDSMILVGPAEQSASSLTSLVKSVQGDISDPFHFHLSD